MNDDHDPLATFSGVARLFPLPNLVLFPSVVQPLHIFEPRYRRMTGDALADDRLLALVLLRPGWEEDYHKRPPVHPVACLGRIFNEQRLADGRYNLLLHGFRRIRILDETEADTPYRQARVELLEDVPPASSLDREQLRGRMEQRLPPLLASQSGASRQVQELFESDLPLGTLSDIFTFALPLDVSFKQELLEELDVARRVTRLLEQLEDLAPGPGGERQFPPEFSPN